MGVWPPSGSGSRRCAERGAAGKAGGGFLGWFPLVSFWMASTVRSQERGSDGVRMGDAGRPGPWDAVCGRREGRGVRGGGRHPRGGASPCSAPGAAAGRSHPALGVPASAVRRGGRGDRGSLLHPGPSARQPRSCPEAMGAKSQGEAQSRTFTCAEPRGALPPLPRR